MVFYNFYEIKEIGRSTNFSFYYFHETNEIVEALGGPSSIVMPVILKIILAPFFIKIILALKHLHFMGWDLKL